MKVKAWSNGHSMSKYWSLFLCAHIMISVAKCRGHTMPLLLQNCTLWYQRGSSGVWNKLLCSPGPTEALIIEASFCVFVHLDPHFGFKFKMNLTFDCVYPYFECDLWMLCILLSFLCTTKFCRWVKKKNYNKVCEKVTVTCVLLLSFVSFFDWRSTTGKAFYRF